MTYQLLRGLRVVDLSTMIPGDAATAVLADLGADVVKVEAPPDGDRVRDIEPLAGAARLSVRHLALNRNKRSIGLDLRNDSGRAVFFDLVRWGDAVFDVSPPGSRDRLGVGYAACAAARADTVYCSLTAYGFGLTLAGAPAHTVGAEAMSGLLRPTAAGGRLELRVPEARVPALASSLAAALAVLAALRYRDRSGLGAWVETSQLRVGVWWQQLQALEELNRLDVSERVPEGGAGARYNFYAAADGGAILLTAVERRGWERFAAAVGHPEWGPRGAWGRSGLDFGIGDVALAAEIAAVIASRPREDWLRIFGAAGVAAVPALGVGELLERPDATDLLVTSIDPRLGPLRMVGPPIGVRGADGAPARPAPDAGADAAGVLSELGYSDARIRELADEGVVFGGEPPP